MPLVSFGFLVSSLLKTRNEGIAQGFGVKTHCTSCCRVPPTPQHCRSTARGCQTISAAQLCFSGNRLFQWCLARSGTQIYRLLRNVNVQQVISSWNHSVSFRSDWPGGTTRNLITNQPLRWKTAPASLQYWAGPVIFSFIQAQSVVASRPAVQLTP